MRMRGLINKLSAYSHRIFLIDGTGALITAVLLFFVVRPTTGCFSELSPRIDQLATAALVFSFYSFSCFFFAGKRWRLLLGIICAANVVYCLCTAWTVARFSERISPLALVYFSVEITVILALGFAELQLLRKR